MSITLLQYYMNLASEINANAFAGIRTRQDWERGRDALRRRYLHSLGLEKLPDSRDPHLEEHRAFRGEGYTARAVSYQIIPECYGSALIFAPDPLPRARCPGVLYLCGHANFGILDYHPHALMWARRGYVCVIIDAIRQADNTGEHSGFSRSGREDWVSMGYTAAGGEFLNSWGGLNVLCALPEVDPERVGATGLSGGGAHCFFLAAADERVKAVASTCGVVSLKHTIVNRHFNSNCDCMFWYNPYQMDTSEYGALIAPRPLLLAHAKGDYLFTPGENRDFHRKLGTIYELYGCPENCSLFRFDGPHSYQPSSVQAINEWFDRHLAGGRIPRGELRPPELNERQCTIWNGDHPVPDRLDILPEILTPPRSFPIPDTIEELAALKKRVMPDLEDRVLHYVVSSRETLELDRVHEWVLDPVAPYPVMRKYRGSMGGMELWITEHLPREDVKDVLVVVCDLGQDDVEALATLPVDRGKVGVITVEPRAGGLNAYAESVRTSLLKVGLYLGVTPVSLWIKDIKEVLAWFRTEGSLAGRNVYLYGARDAGIAAIYATLLDETVKGVIVKDIYRSHKVGGHLPGVLKVLDIEQTLGLLAPRVIGLDTHEWEFVFWSWRIYDRLGILDRYVHTHDMAHTLARIFRD